MPSLCCSARGLQAGDAVEWRQPLISGRAVGGWLSGIVLAVAQGSTWEGGLVVLLRPGSKASVGSCAEAAPANCQPQQEPHLSQQAGGRLCEAAAAASGGEQRGGDTPAPEEGSAGFTAAKAGQVEGQQWVPLLWRGPWANPLNCPAALVRRSCSSGGAVEAADGLRLRQGDACEAQRQGSWWAAEVLQQGEVAADAPDVLLRNALPPEGDGAVWRAPLSCIR